MELGGGAGKLWFTLNGYRHKEDSVRIIKIWFGCRCKYESKAGRVFGNMTDMLETKQAIITDFGERISIEIPSKLNIPITFFMILFLFFSFIFELNLAFQLQHHYDAMKSLLLFIWIIASGAILYAFLWGLTGKEVITIFSDRLKYEKRIIGLPWRREYELSKSKHFRLKNIEEKPWYQRGKIFWSDLVGEEKIVFDYCVDPSFGDEQVEFCQSVDKVEAQYILGIIHKKKSKYDFTKR